MFIGEFEHSIDEKGRLAIPAKFRKGLSQGAVVTRGLDSCLFLYDLNEWKTLAQKISSLGITHANTRAFVRLMLAGAMQVSIDSQGRIILPEYLRLYGKLDRHAVITGLYNRIEIWDKKLWDVYKKETQKDSNRIAETLGELGV